MTTARRRGAARRGPRLALLALLVAVLLGGAATPAAAHPLGNFTINTSSRLVVGTDRVRVDYVVDAAEIPTFQTRQEIDVDGDGQVSAAEAERYHTTECARLVEFQDLRVDGDAVALRSTASAVSFPEGQAGLVTTRLECLFQADTGPLTDGVELTYADTSNPDRVGWREVLALGDETTLTASDVPEESSSDRLRTYPQDRLASPLRVTTASLTVDPSGGPAAPEPALAAETARAAGLVERLTTSFTALVARQQLTPLFGLFAIAVALVLGTFHAVAPGHGKTVMAAYLIGEGGQAREAVMLGATVAVTHTLGVFLLGVVVSVSQTIAPERIYPALGVASGLLFAGVGITLLRRALATGGHGHTHGPGGHTHGPGGHTHGPAGHHHHGPSHHGDAQHTQDSGHAHAHDDTTGHAHDPVGEAVAVAVAAPPGADDGPGAGAPAVALPGRATRGASWRTLILPGLAGGLLPSPSALVVLLGGIALGRTWFGVLLVVAYGIGMAATLVGAGFLLHRARGRLEARARGRWTRLSRLLPAATSSLIILGGLFIAARSLVL